MKRLGVLVPRTNHLKTLLPVMQEALRRGISVHVICSGSEGKPAISAAPHIETFRAKWPWAGWDLAGVVDRHYWAGLDAVIAHGVVHDADMIQKSGVPWVAVDHLHENAWWALTGHPEMWAPWHRICLSGDEQQYLRHRRYDTIQTGYTAFDGQWKSPEEYRAIYGLPQRYMLVGTAVQASGIPSSLWRAYFSIHPGFYKLISGYRGPSYGEILRVLKDYCMANGLALVGKARWKHEDHPAHALFDHYFGDDPLDPHRAFNLMRGATAYAGGISGLAVEAMVAQVPTLNWAYYDPLKLDQAGFRKLREALWVNGIWQCPGIGRLFRVDRQEEWTKMVRYLNTVGPRWPHNPAAAIGVEDATIGKPGASDRVLDACGFSR